MGSTRQPGSAATGGGGTPIPQGDPSDRDHLDDRRDRVLVVGAGSSGLSAAKNLRERGFTVDLVEREPAIGGNWNIDGSHSRVYASTRMISSKPFTQFPDFPMPDADPDYLHHTQVLAYLQRYAAHFGLDDLVELDTEVIGCEPLADGGWELTLDRPAGTTRRRYGHLVVANGHNWYPKMPTYPGQDGFTGEVIHAADYHHSDRFAGKRVVVVGAGNTGCDLVVEAAQRADAAYHSTRRGYWYAPKYTFGRPSDQVSDLIFSLRLPMRLTQTLFESTARLTVGRHEDVGLPRPDHRFLETHPIVNQQLTYFVRHGAIEPVPDIERFERDEVVFTDGRRVTADLVVFATGYLIRFPFLPRGTFPGEDDHPELFRNVLHPDRMDIAVIGLIQPDSGQFCLVHWQSVMLARFLELQQRDPDGARDYLARARSQLDDRSQGGIDLIDSTRHYVEVEHADYVRALAREIRELDGNLTGSGRAQGREVVAGDDEALAQGREAVAEGEEPGTGTGGQVVRRGEPVLRRADWTFPPPPVEREIVSAEPADPDPDRPPLLFVHGAWMGAWAFERWLPDAADAGWQAYAVSLRGHGDSQTPDRFGRTTLRHYEHDVLQAIAQLPAPPVLIGHSMGAAVVQSVLERYRSAPAAALVCPAPPGHGLEVATGMLRHEPRMVGRVLLGASPRPSTATLFGDDVDPEVAAEVIARLGAESRVVPVQVSLPRRHPDVRTPVKVLGGGLDRLVPPHAVLRTARAYGTRAHLFRGMGHLLMFERGWRSPLTLILDWLERDIVAATRRPQPSR